MLMHRRFFVYRQRFAAVSMITSSAATPFISSGSTCWTGGAVGTLSARHNAALGIASHRKPTEQSDAGLSSTQTYMKKTSEDARSAAENPLQSPHEAWVSTCSLFLAKSTTKRSSNPFPRRSSTTKRNDTDITACSATS